MPPTRSTPASLTALAQALASMAASSATGPEASSASKASLSMATATGSAGVSDAAAASELAAAGSEPAALWVVVLDAPPQAASESASARAAVTAVDFKSCFFIVLSLL